MIRWLLNLFRMDEIDALERDRDEDRFAEMARLHQETSHAKEG